MSDVNYISKVTLPSGDTFYIKDDEARQMISGGVSFIIAWDGSGAPTVSNIPAGVVIKYNDTDYVGTMSAESATPGAFYLVRSSTASGISISYSGVTSATVNEDVFAYETDFVTDTVFSFVYNTSTSKWVLNGSGSGFDTLTLGTQYGISVTGTPTNGATITVVTPSSYFDKYDEYVPVGSSPYKKWEKIGDTQLNLTDVVTDVSTTNKTVIGNNATLKVSTQPAFSLTTNAASGTGHTLGLVSGISSVSASGDSVTALTGLGTATTDNALGEATTFSIASASSGKDVTVATGVSNTTKYLSVSASGGTTITVGTNDLVTALTGLGDPSTTSAASSVTPTTKKLATTSITGVSGSTTVTGVSGSVSVTGVSGSTSVYGVKSGTNSTTTASKATVGTATSQTTATGGSTASSSNSDWLKGIGVANETLTFSAVTPSTQTTSIPNVTFSDVTVPIRADSATTVPTAASSATTVPVAAASATTVPIAASSSTTVATGKVADSDTNGASVVTDVSVGDTVTVVTGYSSPTTDSVLGADTTFTGSTPAVSLTANDSSASGRIQYLQTTSANTTMIGVTVGTNDKIAAVTGYASPTTDTVLGTGSTITVTPTVIYPSVNRDTNVAIAWNSKDEQAVVGSVTVTKGNK